MTWLISLDPGRKGFGWAAYEHQLALRQDAQLRAAGVVPQPKGPRDFEQAALPIVAAKVVAAIRHALSWHANPLRQDAYAVVERMVCYPPSPGRRRPSAAAQTAVANDLLDLQAIGALVAGALVERVVYRTPRQWKGTTDTAVLARRLLDEGPGAVCPLARDELAVLRQACDRAGALAHNIVDAAAMGLVEVGRLRLR